MANLMSDSINPSYPYSVADGWSSLYRCRTLSSAISYRVDKVTKLPRGQNSMAYHRGTESTEKESEQTIFTSVSSASLW